jgi:hypothetical protein
MQFDWSIAVQDQTGYPARGMDHSPINQNFELNKSRQKISSQLERA